MTDVAGTERRGFAPDIVPVRRLRAEAFWEHVLGMAVLWSVPVVGFVLVMVAGR